MKIQISPNYKELKKTSWKPGDNPEIDKLVWKYKKIMTQNNWERDAAALPWLALTDWGEKHFGSHQKALEKLVEIAGKNSEYFVVSSQFMRFAGGQIK